MPKSKKKKIRDFQKVKLKAGKGRQGIETNTSFKTRTIKVTQTFKDFSSKSLEPQTKNRLTFEDLLKRSNAHKTVNQRLSAVDGLRELVVASGAVSSSRFSSVMASVAGFFSDPEPVVRQGVLRLCRTLFSAVDERSVDLNLFSAQLCCAMGHVSDDIRRDALVLFDLVLGKCPEKLINEFCRLVPALVNQISSYMVTTNSRSGHRTLAVNPRSKLSSQKWRAEVLLRLVRVVGTYVSKHRRETAPPTEDEQEVFYCGVGKYPVVRGPCMPPSWKRLWTQWPRRTHGCDAQEFAHMASDPEQLQKFITSVLPVVKECWAEEFALEDNVGPSHSVDHSGGPLTQHSLPMLQAVVGLLYSFVECWRCWYDFNHFYQSRWFRKEFLHELRDMFLPHFPIVVTEKVGKTKKGQEVKIAAESSSSGDTSPVQISVLKLNLMVCELLASFPPGEEDDWPDLWVEPEEWQGEVVSFLLRNFKRSIRAGLSLNLGRSLRLAFLHYPYTGKVGRLLAKTQKQFIKAHPVSTEKTIFLDILDELAFDLHVQSPYNAKNRLERRSHELLKPYLQALPQLLLHLCSMLQKGGQGTEVEGIARRASKAMDYKQSPVLKQAVLQHMPQLIDDKNGVFAVLPQSCHENMFLAIYWAFFKIPFPEPILKQIELVIRHPCVDKEICSRLCRTVTGNFKELSKWNNVDLALQQEVESSKMAYLRFLLSVVVGHKAVELEAIDKAHKPETGGLTRIVWTCSLEQFQKHIHVCQRDFQYFNDYLKTSRPDMSVYGVSTMDIMGAVWNEQILKKYGSLNVLTVWGALSHWQFMMEQSQLTEGADLHLDSAPTPFRLHQLLFSQEWQHSFSQQWQQRVQQYLPVFRAHLRPFTHLAFSLLYGIVAMEIKEGGGEEAVVKEMWKVVVQLMGTSLRMLQDLLQVAAHFIQENKSEEALMKTTLGLTKLLAEQAICLEEIFLRHLGPHLESFVTTVKAATPGVETQQWWQDFTRTCACFHIITRDVTVCT